MVVEWRSKAKLTTLNRSYIHQHPLVYSMKVREDDMETRQMLVETVWLLCADETGRKIVKDQGTYRLIDKLYKWECEKGDTGEKSEIAEAELKLIELLIGDEPEYEEHKNFMKVEIPESVQKIL